MNKIKKYFKQNFLNNEPHLVQAIYRFLLNLLLFGFFVFALFSCISILNTRFPQHKQTISMLLALVLPVWVYIGYQYMKHYDEMLKLMLLKSMSISAISAATILLASKMRQTIGHGNSIDEAIMIVFMTTIFIFSLFFLNWKAKQ